MGHTTTATLLLVWAAVITFTHGADVNVAVDGWSHSMAGLASSIADGDVNYCAQTTNSTDHPWFEVDMGRVYPVYNIHIWSHNDFQTHMYPSTITVDEETCTTITESWLGKQKIVWCPGVMYGQRVRIRRDGTDQPLTLCELQIWVPVEVSQCRVGKHGAPCDLDCSAHCGQGPGKNFCDQETARCYDGCVDGWYGDQCSTACSQGCQNEDCDSDTGQCAPCNTGYTGDSCAECEDKHFKTSAGTCVPCNSNCRSQRCLFISGTCAGCVDGYYGDHCDRLCPPLHCRRCLQFSGFCYECALNSNLLTPECTAKQEAISSTVEDNIKVVAVSVGAVVVILVLIVIIVCIVMKRRIRRRRQQTAIPRQTSGEHTAETSIDPQDNRLENYCSQPEGFDNAAQDSNYDVLTPVACGKPAQDDPTYLKVELA